MVDRIKQVMEHYEETPAGFAEKIGVNRSNITHLFSGRNQPSLDFAKKVLTAFPEVSTEWLIMGVGKMIKDPAEMVPVKKTFVQTDLFGTVDESEKSAPAVEEVKEIASEQVAQQPSEEILLENVKPVAQEIPSAEPAQQIDTEDIKSKVETFFPVPESNIQQQAVSQPEKSDSRMVEHEDEKPTPMHSIPQPKEKSVTPSVEKPQTKSVAMSVENTQARPLEQPMAVQTEQTTAPKEKKIEKIIFFYDDDTFKVYHP